jgi:hypothetical protein
VKVSGTLGLGGIEPLKIERQSTQPTASNSSKAIEDSLTLSSAARAREVAATHPRFGALSVHAHADPALADQLAYDYAHIVHGPIVDLTDEIAGTGPAKYAATGEPVTPERDAFYRRQAEGVQAASLSLYHQERAKGTDAADIFDKLIALGDSQSVEFRDIIDWEAKIGLST